MTISAERTKQLDIFCRITGFTSDFLSFIDVELIRFFHGALQVSDGGKKEIYRDVQFFHGARHLIRMKCKQCVHRIMLLECKSAFNRKRIIKL